MWMSVSINMFDISLKIEYDDDTTTQSVIWYKSDSSSLLWMNNPVPIPTDRIEKQNKNSDGINLHLVWHKLFIYLE